MGVYIKGMDMPISCEKCPLCYDYLCCSIDNSLHMFLYNRHPNCPLIEIPDSHGSLKEELEKKLYEYIDPFEVPGALEACYDTMEAFYDAMDRFTKGE